MRNVNRRKFIQNLSILSVAPFTMPFATHALGPAATLNVLVLGGTNFVGPAVVNSLLNKGHQVTLFNRGITNPLLFPGLRKIRGDRKRGKAGYKLLKEDNSHWDVVIDVWPQNPHYVEEAIQAIKDKATHYIFISSIAVYSNYKIVGMNEDARLREATSYVEGNYNQNKVLCEQVVKKYFPANFTIVRPGAIIGDRDSGPFATDLLNRVANCKEIFAPQSNDPVQFIDAVDIGRFLAQCAESKVTGHFTLVGPQEKLGYREMLLTIKETLKSKVKIHWIDPNYLTIKMKLEPFMDVPFWIPIDSDPDPGFYQISNDRAIKSGLVFSDFKETIRRSYDSFKSKRFIPEEGSELTFGITPAREKEIISLWKESLND